MDGIELETDWKIHSMILTMKKRIIQETRLPLLSEALTPPEIKDYAFYDHRS